MRTLILAAACGAALTHPVHAQDDDRGRLSSSSNRSFRMVTTGRCASTASAARCPRRPTLDRLSISDADGEWLILEGARLNWRRAALLSGANWT
jgi:hypothetical protein